MGGRARSTRRARHPSAPAGAPTGAMYRELGTNWTFDESQGPSDGLASEPHLAVGVRASETPSSWVVHRIARALRSPRSAQPPPRPRRPRLRNPGLLAARLQLRRLREAGFQRLIAQRVSGDSEARSRGDRASGDRGELAPPGVRGSRSRVASHRHVPESRAELDAASPGRSVLEFWVAMTNAACSCSSARRAAPPTVRAPATIVLRPRRSSRHGAWPGV